MDRSDRNASSQPGLESLEPRLLLAGTMVGQYFAWLVNRARHDPAAFQDEHDTIITVSLANAPSMPPLAYNELLMDAASWKASDMFNNAYNADTDSLGRMPNQTVIDMGYNLSGQFGPHVNNPDNDVESRSVGQANADNALATMLQDDGKADADAIRRVRLLGLDTPTNHDALVLREIGADDVGGDWVAETACQGGQVTFLTGVCYHDNDGDGRYDLGEGFWINAPSVQVMNITVPFAVNADGGTWSVVVPNSPTTYSVKVTGGDWVGTSNATVMVRGSSVEVDFINGMAAGIVDFGGGSLKRPPAPTVISASDGLFPDKVHLTWSASATANSYTLYRNTTNNANTAVQIGTATTLTFDDTNVAYGPKYYYWVAGVNANGTGKKSTPDTGWFNAPPTVGGVTADPTTVIQSGTLALTATNVQDVDDAIGKVQFYRDVNGNGTYDQSVDVAVGLGTLTGGAWTWTGRAVGFPAGTVSLLARACDSAGAWSAAVATTITVQADTTPPQASFTGATVTEAPGAKLTFTVTYTDNAAVKASTIDSKDIQVSGPGGFNKLATLVQASSKTDGTPIAAVYSIPAPGGNWDYADNGDYTVALLDNQITDANGLLVAGATLGTITMALANSPDLAASLGVIKAPAPLVPGDKVTVPVVIKNIGGLPAKGKIDIRLILTNPGANIVLGTKTASVSLNPGASTTVSFLVTLPPQTREGGYFFDATADVTQQIPDPDPGRANNECASALYAVVEQFGAVGLRKNVKLLVSDPDGTLATFAMTGTGNGTLTGGGLVITATTSASGVTVTTAMSKTPGDDGKVGLSSITVGDPANPADRTSLGKLTAKTTNLEGDFTITGGLGTLVLADVKGGRTVTIGPGAKLTDAAALTFNKVSDLVLASAMPIRSLAAVEWLAPTPKSNSISAPSIGTLAIKGDAKQSSRGDFGAVVNLTNPGAKQSLTTMTVAGMLDGAEVRARSAIGTVTVGAMQNALIFAGVKDTVTGLPDPAADFDATTSIGTVKVNGLKTPAPWTINSSIAAAKLGTITLAGIQFTNANPFGLAGHSLTRLTYKYVDGTQTKTYSWPNKDLAEKVHPLPRDQFEVNLA